MIFTSFQLLALGTDAGGSAVGLDLFDIRAAIGAPGGIPVGNDHGFHFQITGFAVKILLIGEGIALQRGVQNLLEVTGYRLGTTGGIEEDLDLGLPAREEALKAGKGEVAVKAGEDGRLSQKLNSKWRI